MAGKLEKIRNMGIMAHIDAGKTTVSERVLYYSGRTHRIAEVHDGEATMDWMDQERERGITITSAVTNVLWRDYDLHLIDTPGHVDFTVEVERALRVLDGVIALYDAVAGVEPQSETVWYQAERYRVPRLAFANKMDRPGADFERCVKEVREILKAHPIPIQLPIGAGHDFEGVVDLVNMKVLHFSEDDQGTTIASEELPEELQVEAGAARDHMLELLADVDDTIAQAYLEGEPIDAAMIRTALRRATIDLEAVPFLCGSGLKNKGVQPLLDAVVDYLPAPDDLPPVIGHGMPGHDGEELSRACSEKEPLSALAFKVQFIEGRKIIYLRVYSGLLKEGANVMNSTQNTTMRVKNLFRMHANHREKITEAGPGSIIAMAETRLTRTGDTLCDPDHPIILERINAGSPAISVSIEPETLREKDKLADALIKLTEEDPTLLVEENQDTGDLIMRGMGELHLEIICERLRRDFGVAVRRGHPHVVTKETITSAALGHGIFLREADDEVVFGDVRVAVTPNARGTGNTYRLDLPSDHDYLKPELLDMAMKGIGDALNVGPIASEEMTDVDVRIVALGSDPKFVSTPIGCRVAAGEAFRNATRDGNPVTLEPLMAVDVVILGDQIGDVISDLTMRGGTIENVSENLGRSIVHAIVPLRMMFGYSGKLRSITQGRGVFTMTFRAFDQVAARHD